jgi:hypothetical protein
MRVQTLPTPSLTESGVLPSGVTFTDNENGTATLSGTRASGTGGTYTLFHKRFFAGKSKRDLEHIERSTSSSISAR